jgi:predicted phosphodiesterase
MSLEQIVRGEYEMDEKQVITRNVVLPDIHYPHHDEKAVGCVMKIMKDYKPHRIILAGDYLDMEPVSHWIQDKKRVMENKRLMDDYKGANKLLDNLIRVSGKQLKEVIYLHGNHEHWLEQYIDRHPEMEGLIEVENHIKVKDPKIKLQFVPMNDFYKLGKLHITHGLFINKYHASKTLESTGRSVMYGHTHDISMFSKMGLIEDEKHVAMSIGCLTNLSPAYMKNRPHNWIHGMALVDVRKGGRFTSLVVPIYDGEASIMGKLYKHR